jgi:branched-chain amino acid transport system permease protein
MSLNTFVQQSINGLSLGGMYALLALGLALLYSIMGLINFAHGELITITGYVMWALMSHSVPWLAAVPISLLSAVVAAILMERIAFRPFRGADLVTLLLTSFAISLLLQTLFTLGISAQPEPVSSPGWLSKVATVGSYTIPRLQIITTITAFICLGLLAVFLKTTTLGVSIRAAAEDFPVVRLMGVNANRVVVAAFAISGLLAGVAAILYNAQAGNVAPTTGITPVIKAFIAVIIGGLGSLGGAVAGGFLLGFTEVIFLASLPDSLKPFVDAFTLLLVITILVARPQGLLPRASSSRN